MMHRLSFIFSILLFWLANNEAFAGDSTRVAVKSGPQIYIDYGKLLFAATDFETKFEFGLAYQFKNRFQPNFQIGMSKVEPASAIENGTYLAEGQYWRAGLNYIIPIDNFNNIFIGLKYGASKFEDSGTYEITSDLWGTFSGEFERKNLEADWYELILGSEKSMLNGHLKLGGVFGVRIIESRTKFDFIDVYAVPGYGRTLDKTVPFVNLFLKIQI